MEVHAKRLVFQDVREDLRQAIAKDTVTIKNEGLAVDQRSVSEPGCQDALDFQKKITPRTRSKIAEMEEDDQLFNLALEARLHAVETIKQSQQELIVVASFVDRIPNLAGLTRTCEVFRAAGLVVADKSILEDKQFRLIRFGCFCLLPSYYYYQSPFFAL